MRAVTDARFGPPEVLQLVREPKPVPKARDVLIRVHAATVCKEDPDMRAAPGFNGLLKPRRPILGQEFAGEVEAVGPDASRFRPGDRVFGMDAFGAYAEYKCLSEEAALARMPAGLTYAEAASVPNGALTALPFLRDHGHIRRGQAVLVYGASGSVGTAAVQLARAYGAEVTGVCSTQNLELVRSLGATRVVDYTREDFTRQDHTYDIIFDAVGKLALARCWDRLAKDGVYLTVIPGPGVLLRGLWASLAGGRRARFAATGLRSARQKAADLCFVRGLIETGQFRPVIDRRYPLEQIAQAHHYVQGGHKKGNVVITID